MPDAVDASAPLTDLLGRPVRDLRISVTDRCNLRCRYCMPREVFGADFPFLERDELLAFEEIALLVTGGIAAMKAPMLAMTFQMANSGS